MCLPPVAPAAGVSATPPGVVFSLAGYSPEKLLVVTTGSQAEPRAMLSRAAYNGARNLKLTTGDLLLYRCGDQPSPPCLAISIRHRSGRFKLRTPSLLYSEPACSSADSAFVPPVPSLVVQRKNDPGKREENHKDAQRNRPERA